MEDEQKLTKKQLQEQKRLEEKQKIEKSQRVRKLRKWGIITVIFLVGAGGFFWLIKELTKPLPGKEIPDLGRGHVTEDKWSKFTYNSNPPTSGPHDADWTKSGIYNKAQGVGHLIHSLEHGYVIIWYDCDIKSQNIGDTDLKDCTVLKKQLTQIATDNRLWKLIVVSRGNMDMPIVLTAWGRIEKLQKPDVRKIKEFIDTFRDKGPEQTME